MSTDSSQTGNRPGPSAADIAAAEAMMAGQVIAPSAPMSHEGKLDVILDVPVTLSLEVGRTRLPIRSLLQLNQGSVVELERKAGDPLGVCVKGRWVGHGEVVVLNDKSGIRLIDVISPAQRIRKLK